MGVGVRVGGSSTDVRVGRLCIQELPVVVWSFLGGVYWGGDFGDGFIYDGLLSTDLN